MQRQSHTACHSTWELTGQSLVVILHCHRQWQSQSEKMFENVVLIIGLVHKKWLPLEDIEARDLKFGMGPYFTYTNAVRILKDNKKELL